jgi:hypothetical protein
LHREDRGGVLCHPAGLHIWGWFLELTRTRGKHTIVISGMAGSQVIHESAMITYSEIAAWQSVTGRMLNSFEARILTTMDNIYVAGVNGGKQKGKTGQGLGEYCQNKYVDDCRKQFGDNLEQACSTCPS